MQTPLGGEGDSRYIRYIDFHPLMEIPRAEDQQERQKEVGGQKPVAAGLFIQESQSGNMGTKLP